MLVSPEMMFIPKALVQGAATACGSATLLPGAVVSIPYFETYAPLWGVSFAIGIAGSLLADGAHSYIIQDTHFSKKHKNEAALFLGAVLSGGLFVGGLYLTNSMLPGEYGLAKAFAVGAGGELIAAVGVGLVNEML